MKGAWACVSYSTVKDENTNKKQPNLTSCNSLRVLGLFHKGLCIAACLECRKTEQEAKEALCWMGARDGEQVRSAPPRLPPACLLL